MTDLPEPKLTAIQEAAKDGDLEKVKTLYVDTKSLEGVVWFAGMNGHLDIIKWAVENGEILDSSLTRAAAFDGHLHILKYAREQDVPWNNSVIHSCCYNGHLECIRYVIANGCSWSNEATELAASQGHLSILQFAHENNLFKSIGTMDSAAYSGHFECLKYAYEHNFPRTGNTAKSAIQGKKLDCLRYCIENVELGWDPVITFRDCIIANNMECFLLCCEYAKPYINHIWCAFDEQHFDLMSKIYQIVKEDMKNCNLDSLIHALNGNGPVIIDYRARTRRNISFEEIKHDLHLRELFYLLGDYTKKPLINKTILGWIDDFRAEKAMYNQVATNECEAIIPTDVIVHNIHPFF